MPLEESEKRRHQYIGTIQTTGSSGVLCLVRFHQGELPVAVVGANRHCMGGCPGLAFFPLVGPASHVLPVGADGTSIDTASGPPVVVTDDPRFWGKFTDLADSANPMRVFTVNRGRPVNVSAEYPLHVAHNAATWWAAFLHPWNGPRDGLGALAAWAADECTLGRQDAVWRTLDELLRAGRLHNEQGWVSGARYVHHLERLLIRTGYAR